MFDQRWNEADWRNESAAAERDERRREARDLADWHAGDSPELTAFLNETTPDAPGGRVELSTAPEPINFGVELSTTQMLRARFGKRVA
jgi:hypothetical protein